MGNRKPLSQKIRFEVFKRDCFTCQYCGRMAPDVVLEVDHINPIVNGGDNDILNLITSCFDCNRGKGKRKLSEKEEIKKQQEQLKELSEKREQLKMMLDWRRELNNFNDELVDEFEKELKRQTKTKLTSTGKDNVSEWIKSFGLIETLDCLNISVSQYYDENDIDGTINKTFNYIPKIARVRRSEKKDPTIYKKNYIKGILTNRVGYVNDRFLYNALKGLSVEELEDIQEIALFCNSWTDFKNLIKKEQ